VSKENFSAKSSQIIFQLTIESIELSDDSPEIVVHKYRNGVLTDHKSVYAMNHVRQLYQSLKVLSSYLD